MQLETAEQYSRKNNIGILGVAEEDHENLENKIRELKNHDEVHDDDVCWLGKDWNENVSFGGKKES